jgi:glutamate 5-kinase
VSIFRGVKRIVVKVGTKLIADDSGRLDGSRLSDLANQIADLVDRGYQLILVSSGAIAAGVEGLNLSERPSTMPELQAAASVGQGLLIHQYSELFRKRNIHVGQVLLTQYDTTHRTHYLNARNTLNKLLDFGAVPVINENDTTAVDEIRFGENDTLAALVSCIIGADLLILLSDIEGLHRSDPRKDRTARLLSEVEEITPAIEKLAGGAGSKFASGGMVTKIQAAKIATCAGTGMIIANGGESNVLTRIMDGEPLGTFFVPPKKKISSRKLWIAFGRLSKGTIVVDDGAKTALIEQGRSLLPAGVLSSEGSFNLGDAVNVADREGNVFGKGLINFSSEELNRVKGLKSSEIASKFSEDASDEVIHRDCLVILK